MESIPSNTDFVRKKSKVEDEFEKMKYGVEIWAMWAQLDLKVKYRRLKRRESNQIFNNFGIKKFT
jgi:hypothetical protein